MSDPDLQWYLSRDGKKYGPFYEVDLDRFHRTKQLLPTDLLWHEGLGEWQPGSSYKPQSQRLQELQKATTDRSVPRPSAHLATEQQHVWVRQAIGRLAPFQGNKGLRILLRVAVVLGCSTLLGFSSAYVVGLFMK
jgi:uncharacterized protein DUF4339